MRNNKDDLRVSGQISESKRIKYEKGRVGRKYEVEKCGQERM
jgi:hypothetical protein